MHFTSPFPPKSLESILISPIPIPIFVSYSYPNDSQKFIRIPSYFRSHKMHNVTQNDQYYTHKGKTESQQKRENKLNATTWLTFDVAYLKATLHWSYKVYTNIRQWMQKALILQNRLMELFRMGIWITFIQVVYRSHRKPLHNFRLLPSRAFPMRFTFSL